MRHRVYGYKLSRDSEDRRSLRRNLAVALFTHEQITTTLPKAKSVQPFVEKLITLARKGDLSSRRRVIAQLRDFIMVKNDTDDSVKRNKYGELLDGPRVVKKLFAEIAPRYTNRAGGYTRIVKLATHRIGDGSDLCVLQLVGEKDFRDKPGTSSNRRKKADRRTELAAKFRKARSGAEVAPAEDKPAAETAPAAEQK